MSSVRQESKTSYVSPRTNVLLAELGEECQRVLKLLAQLEIPGQDTQVEAILGELSAAVLHVHEHTRGLDAIIDADSERG
jgi:hypothetical protein